MQGRRLKSPTFLLLHRQRNTLALAVHFRHTHYHMLMQLHNIIRVLHISVSKLRDMYQSVLMHTYIYESSEIRDVRHDARQKHTHLQIAYLVHTWVELEHLYRSTWSRPGRCNSAMISVSVSIPTVGVT